MFCSLLWHSFHYVVICWSLLTLQWCVFSHELTAYMREPPGRNGWQFADNILKCIFFKWKLWYMIQIWLEFVPWGPVDSWSALVQVMAWCHQAPSHYLSWCWWRSMSPYGVTWPQWVKYIYERGPWTECWRGENWVAMPSNKIYVE